MKIDESLLKANELIARLEEAQQSISNFTLARPSDCAMATTALEKIFDDKRILFRRRNAAFIASFFDSVERLESAKPIRAYPNELLRLFILKGRVFLETGDPERALDVIRDVADRPYLVEGDASNVKGALVVKLRALLALGRIGEAAAVSHFGFHLMSRRAPQRALSIFRDFSSGLQFRAPLNGDFESIALLARLRIALTREHGHPITRRLRRGIRRAVDIFAFSFVWFGLAKRRLIRFFGNSSSNKNGARPKVLVTRAMGGAGDLIMMIPGLKALAKREGEAVHFATKRQFFPLLEGHDDIVLHDINGPKIEIGNFSKWFDLSYCPGARYESRHRPNINKGRVELFAAGMGVSNRELRESGVRPTINLQSDGIGRAAEFFAKNNLDASKSIIGVHAFSRDTYKDYPHMLALIARLAQKFKVVVFHDTTFELPHHSNVVSAFNQPLADVLAIFARCQIAVCADSFFLHAAAALNIPTIALFGPTDGEMFTRHHPNAHVVSMRASFKCMPCWRNEDTPCFLSGGHESVCMAAIDEGKVAALVERIDRHLDVNGRETSFEHINKVFDEA